MRITGEFLAELRRRNVLRMAGLYLVGAWLVVQVGATLLPVFGAPSWAMRALVATLAAAFVPVLVSAWVFKLSPEGFKPGAQHPANESLPLQQTGKRLDRAIMLVLAIALGYFAFDKFVLEPRRTAALVAQTTAEVARKQGAESSEHAIAILPLVNASGDADQQYFSDGLSENLIVALSKFDGLRVIGRTSSFQFRDSKDDVRTIGRKLGVAYLLAGSVQRADKLVRIRAEVVRTRDGSALWSQSYDRPYRDLFALQDELTRAIADVLKARLLPGNRTASQSDRPPSGNVDAYSAYLRGSFHADRATGTDVAHAISELEQATRIDPRYAMAWAALSRTWTTRAASGLSGDDARKAYAQARKAGDMALALAPDLGYAHVARGWLLENAELDWQGATTEYQRALQLAPGDLQTKFSYASMLGVQGRLHEALKLTRQALDNEPLSANWWNWLSAYQAGLWKLDDAEVSVRRYIELLPQASSGYAQLALIQVQRGDPVAALAAARREPEGPWHEIAIAMALQIGPDRTRADAALKQLIDTHGAEAPFQIAQVQALRHDADATFEWLERARVNRDPGIANTLIDPLLMIYKNDPRMAEFCRRNGLPSPLTSETRGLH